MGTGGVFEKTLARADTPLPPISVVKVWPLPKIFDFFKRKKKFLEDELKNFFCQKMPIG